MGFTSGTIDKIVEGISGEAYLDLEKEAIGIIRRVRRHGSR